MVGNQLHPLKDRSRTCGIWSEPLPLKIEYILLTRRTIDFTHGKSVESIRVADFSGIGNDVHIYRVEEVQLHVCAYVLQDEGAGTRRSKRHSTGDGEESGEALRTSMLPSKDLVGAWEGLIFEDNIPNRLLRFASGMSESMSGNSFQNG